MTDTKKVQSAGKADCKKKKSAPADTTKKKKSVPADTTKKKKSVPADTTKKKKSVPADTTKKKKSAPVIRSRSFNLVLYPDCPAHCDILYYLSGDNPEGIKGFYILHKGEKDLDENGNEKKDDNGNTVYKKDHWHVCITYKNARTKCSVVKAFAKQISEPCIQPTSDINFTYLYYLHRTYDCFTAGKTVYQHVDIKPLGNNSIDYLSKISGLKNDTVSAVQNLFECAKVSASAPDMLQIVLDNFGERELKTLMKNAYFCKTFMLGGK